MILTQNQMVIGFLSRTWLAGLFVFSSAAEKVGFAEKRFLCLTLALYLIYRYRHVGVDMLKGLLKMSMLKIISENKTTGYQIIKRVTQLTSEKPSTGSIYPLLKTMQNKGWIIGTTQNGKTTYEITANGLAVLLSHGSLKDYYEQKLNGSISLVHGTFNSQNVPLTHNLELANPVVDQVASLLAHGVAPEKINAVLNSTLDALQKLMED